MTLIFKYIFRRIFFSTVLLTCVLVAAVWLTQSLRFLDMIVNRNVSLQGYFYLVGFLVPDLLVVILPICLFISVVFFYNKFQADHELSIWRSTGFSNMQIAKPVIVLSLLVVVFTFIVNVYVLPSSFKQFKDMEHTLRQQFSGAMIQEGRFNNVKNTTIYIKQRFRSGRMEDIFLYSHDTKHPYTIFAKEGRINAVDDGLFLMLKSGFRQEKDPKTNQFQVLKFDSLNYDLSELTKTDENRTIRPYEKGIFELLKEDPKKDQATRAKYRAAAHQRILQPFFGFIYVLIALNFMLQPQFNRRGRRAAVFSAFACGFLFHVGLTTCINFNGRIYGSIYIAYTLFAVCVVGLFLYLFEYRRFEIAVPHLRRYHKGSKG